MADNPAKVECTIPVLPVTDLQKSIAFYKRVLGFTVEWGDHPGSTVCSVARDKRSIMLQLSEPGTAHGKAWIGLDRGVLEAVAKMDVRIIQPPQNHEWAYDMTFADPDGNVLWLGAEPREDIPKVR